jgi:hypothetical protein
MTKAVITGDADGMFHLDNMSTAELEAASRQAYSDAYDANQTLMACVNRLTVARG